VLNWYAGTVNLAARTFGVRGERIYRRLGDSGQPQFDGVQVPWYSPIGASHGSADVAWEGIGTGWYLSRLGGGSRRGLEGPLPRVPVSHDNTEATTPSEAVPGVFNGDFESGLEALTGGTTFPLTDRIPGWSFHGAPNAQAVQIVETTYGNHAVLLLADLPAIEHNRMLLPDGALLLQLEMQVLATGVGDRLVVTWEALPPEGGTTQSVELASIAIGAVGDDFQAFVAAMDQSLWGTVGRLRVELVDEAGGAVEAQVLVDDVMIGNTFVVDRGMLGDAIEVVLPQGVPDGVGFGRLSLPVTTVKEGGATLGKVAKRNVATFDTMLQEEGKFYFVPDFSSGTDRFSRKPINIRVPLEADVVVPGELPIPGKFTVVLRDVRPGYSSENGPNPVETGAIARLGVNTYRLQQRLRWLGFPDRDA
jgi:hypothetical protein